MPDRASIFELVQLGVESTAGTKVAATKKAAALQINMGSRVDVSTYRPSGTKYVTVASLNKEWSEGTIAGPITYTEIIYMLSSVLKTTTPTGTSSKTWVFTPAASSADTKATYTVESGSSVRAHRFGYGLVTGLGLKFSRSNCEMDGSIIGQQLTDGWTMTPALSSVSLIPTMPTEVKVYLADTQAGLAGATALARVISAEWSIADRFGPVWVLNGTSTFATDVETEPKLELKLMVEADAEGMGLFTTMRSGATKFVRIEATSTTEVTTGVYYKLTIDTACKVTDVSDFSDEDGVYAIEWTLTGAYDATWTKATEVTVINNLAAL